MKRYVKYSAEDQELFTQQKKQKVVHLSDIQRKIADRTIPYILNQGRTDLIDTQFKLSFNPPKKVESLLAYSNYQMF